MYITLIKNLYLRYESNKLYELHKLFCSRTAVLYVLCNLAVGIFFVCLVYLWMARLETNGITLIGPKIPELFLLTLMYDVATRCFINNAQIWAAVMFLIVVFTGLISMVINYCINFFFLNL